MIYDIIVVCLLGWFLVEFPLFELIPSIIIDRFKVKNEMLKFLILKPFQCYKCAAWWIGLIYCIVLWKSLLIAIAASFLMKLYDQKLNSIEL